MESRNLRKIFAVTAVLAFVGLVVAWNPDLSTAQAQSSGGPNGANKVAIAGSGIGFLGAANRVDPLFEPITIHTSDKIDLIYTINTECALWTAISVLGDGQTSEATARVKVYLTLDGVIVPVASDDTEDPGKVVFCDRVYGMTFTSADGEDDKIDSYQRTRSANSFSWMSLNVGNGYHTVQAFVELETATVGEASAEAGYGKRTLVIDPVQLPNDATI